MNDLETENKISEIVIGCAIDIHNELGPGLLESVYQKCLYGLLTEKGFAVEQEKIVPIQFREMTFESGLRLDLLVEDKVILELKACEKILPIHEAQLYTYLKLTKKKLGLILNFNSKLMKNGIKRMVMT